MKESELQRLVMDWLTAKHILAFRMNVGAMKIDKRFVKYGVMGMADILAFIPVMCSSGDDGDKFIQPCWIELKTDKGKQSEFQKSFQAQVEEHGHTYILARSLEEAKKAFR